MMLIHKLSLYTLLGLLGVSLLFPGLMGIFGQKIGTTWLVADAIDARNHLRALNGMMAALGLIALWAAFDLENSRQLVMALGIVMALLVIARLYSLVTDGWPGGMTFMYLVVEAVMAVVFLVWPPR